MTDRISERIVIILVHGTRAREAEWTEDGSKILKRLKAQNSSTRVEFCRFKWSGGNTHADRLIGARLLREMLTTSLEEPGKAPHFIVAHSHGGNVALYAMQDDQIRRRISGVVCMGTPFLHMEHRPLPRGLLSALVITLGILGVIATSYLFTPPQDPLTKSVVYLSLSLLSMVLFLWGVLRWRARGLIGSTDLPDSKSDPEGFLHALSLPNIDPDKLLSVRITGDEASGVLIASQFLSWLLRVLWNSLQWFWERFNRNYGIAIGILGVGVMGVMALGWLGAIPMEAAVSLGSIAAFIALTAIGLVFLVIGLITYFMIVLMLLARLPFSEEVRLSRIQFQVAAEPTPVGEACVYHVKPDINATGKRHSQVYENAEAINFIGAWICQRAQRHQNSDQSF